MELKMRHFRAGEKFRFPETDHRDLQPEFWYEVIDKKNDVILVFDIPEKSIDFEIDVSLDALRREHRVAHDMLSSWNPHPVPMKERNDWCDPDGLDEPFTRGWTMRKFEVHSKLKDNTHDGRTQGQWGVRNGGRSFSLYHLPTGGRIGFFDRMKDAQKFAGKLDPFIDGTIIKDLVKYSEIRRSHKRY